MAIKQLLKLRINHHQFPGNLKQPYYCKLTSNIMAIKQILILRIKHHHFPGRLNNLIIAN